MSCTMCGRPMYGGFCDHCDRAERCRCCHSVPYITKFGTGDIVTCYFQPSLTYDGVGPNSLGLGGNRVI
jgi:hypothetical protein